MEISNAAARAKLDALTALLNGGSLSIYDSSSNLLATLGLGSPAFAAAVDASPNATATANAITPDTNVSAGIAWFFIARSSTSADVITGSAGGSGDGKELTLDNKTFTTGGTVTITSWVITEKES